MAGQSTAPSRPAGRMTDDTRDLLASAAQELGVPLSDAQVDDFAIYLEELLRWDKKINLTALSDPDEIVVKHFVDSLTLVPHVKMGAFVLDVGSGAGFPGLPLKIARPDVRVLLLESTGKKVAFLNEITRQLALKNCRSVQQRAEDKAFQDIMGNKADCVVTRATGAMPQLVTAVAPYLKSGGQFVAMRGPSDGPTKDSVGGSQLARLRLTEPSCISLRLPEGAGDRRLFIFTKR